MSQEIWKNIDWFEWLYKISNLGNVKSLKNGRWWIWKETILKNNLWSNWYYNVDLYNNIRKNYTIHRLVAQTFIPNIEGKPYVNHKDWNKLNNMVQNLEWVTASENIRHKFDVLWYKVSDKHKKQCIHNNIKYKSKKVNQYDLEWNFIKTWDSTMDVERELWVRHQTISKVCNWKRKKTWWYKWEYLLQKQWVSEGISFS